MIEVACQALIVHCMDYRLQKSINNWLQRRFGVSDYDRVSLAGGVKDLEVVLKQVEICERVHGIRQVVFVNHEDCRAYGEAGDPDRHFTDLREAERRCKARFPLLDVELFYLHLTGIFEKVPTGTG